MDHNSRATAALAIGVSGGVLAGLAIISAIASSPARSTQEPRKPKRAGELRRRKRAERRRNGRRSPERTGSDAEDTATAQRESELWRRAEERAVAKLRLLEGQHSDLLGMEVAEAERRAIARPCAPAEQWLCPVSRSLMEDPVVAADGHTCTCADACRAGLPPHCFLTSSSGANQLPCAARTLVLHWPRR
jgi:hypothetical protein